MNIYVYLLGLEEFCKNEDEVNQYKIHGNGMNFFRTEVFYWRNIIISFCHPQLQTECSANERQCRYWLRKNTEKLQALTKGVVFHLLTFLPCIFLRVTLFCVQEIRGAGEGGAWRAWAITLHTHFNHIPFRVIKLKSNVIYNLEHCSQSFLNITAAM